MPYNLTNYARRRCAPALRDVLYAAEPFLNLGFEAVRGSHPYVWNTNGNGYVATADSTVVHSGKYSLRMECVGPCSGSGGANPLTLPELGLAVGTRAALGVGIGLLISNKFNKDQRKAAGLALLTVGVLSTIPIVANVIGKRSAEKSINLAA